MGNSNMHHTRYSVRSPWFIVVLSIITFVVSDGILFRSGFYPGYLNSDTFLGDLVHTVDRESARKSASTPSMLIMGNSQIDFGFSPAQYMQEHPDNKIHLYKADSPNTHEKAWYYELQRIDPTHDKFDYILVALENYTINSTPVDEENDYETAQLVSPILKFGEWPGFIKSYSDPTIRYRVLMLALFPGHEYAMDIQDFLIHPGRRLWQMKILKQLGDTWRFAGTSREGAFEDLKIDSSGRVNACPQAYTSFECRGAENVLRYKTTENLAAALARRNANYRSTWTNRIVKSYADSRTKLIFIQMPRWPQPMVYSLPIASALDIRDLIQRQQNVMFADRNLFTSLETPHYFHDNIHLDVFGRKAFTTELGDLIAHIVNRP